jgi:hypothetical protein
VIISVFAIIIFAAVIIYKDRGEGEPVSSRLESSYFRQPKETGGIVDTYI